jgi:hypothetical protein
VLVRTYILTILDSGFLFNPNYGTAVACVALFIHTAEFNQSA